MRMAADTRLQRASGDARIAFKRRGAQTVLADLHQSGCGKIRLPRTRTEAPAEAVLINTAGGLTDGDVLRTRADWEAGSAALVTTQAAERIYRARGDGAAAIDNRLRVGERATAVWWPQETILFDGSRLERRLEVDLAPSASLLAVESIVFGRGAMGESVHHGAIRDEWRVRRAGELVFADGFALDDSDGALQTQLDRPAIGGGARSTATMLLVAPAPDEAVVAIRDALSQCDVTAGVSRVGAVVVARCLAEAPTAMRDTLQGVFDAITSCGIAAGNFTHFSRPRVFDC